MAQGLKKIELINGMMQDGRISMTVYEIASEKALAMTDDALAMTNGCVSNDKRMPLL
ncbi:hypothetical protein KsCSTR_36520 [Candidatus Kuenenia stuttgartiensis]|uniref:Uncharacterized protein n=2 Tax=Kuenenia stuttgartiensis TaxID=174633 RepID=Q1Q6G5_KUEST|nr:MULTISPECIES: hypothetical protein [Kuenenia]MBE7548393.1 hypothetical protein [Planctomycetia bacterium]MCZ7620952.1 hypothetical protein [Candidatus Kuenenia sp.]QII13031.1 hypothetical protein KsCSTR_36520 [Candidatus Kuenenia stuttgartiensis]CAJ73166.1 unknown protein [Candidatus Kuenenia stuttgartiensis]